MAEDYEAQFKRDLESAFSTVSFTEYYPQIMRRYADLGFSDPLTDKEKIDEAWWIVQQLRKYMGKKRIDVLKLTDDLDGMYSMFEEMKRKADEVVPSKIDENGRNFTGRKTLVYHMLRDEWIDRMLVSIDTERTNRKEQDGSRADGPDEWDW